MSCTCWRESPSDLTGRSALSGLWGGDGARGGGGEGGGEGISKGVSGACIVSQNSNDK